MSVASPPATIRSVATPTCPACGQPGSATASAVVDRILRTPGTWTIRECAACRRAWLDPRPIETDLAMLYVGAYMTHDVDPSAGLPGVTSIRRVFLRQAYGYGRPGAARWLRRAAPLDGPLGGDVAWLPAVADGRLLDVGCGSGAFLASMRARGWRVSGVEPDPDARVVAHQRFNLDVVDAIGALGDRTFDAMVLHHVVEHLPDPRRTLADLAARLAPGGRLVLVTPNIDSLGRRWFGAAWVHWDPPRHLHLFSRTSLAAEVERAGLVVERAFTTGRHARFVGIEGIRIRRTGRVGTARAPNALRALGVAYQLFEGALGLVAGTVGEELVVVAARPRL